MRLRLAWCAVQTANRHLAAIAAATAVFLIVVLASCTRRNEKFDRRRWIDAHDVGALTRLRMLHDVSTSILYVGMSRASVESALGRGNPIESNNVRSLSFPIYRESIDGPVLFLDLQMDDRDNVVGWSEVKF